MSKAQYDIYIGKVINLSKTMVIKSTATADAINQTLFSLGLSINDNDPRSWKYYLNLSGQYHSSDRKMSVTSLDTLQTIEFTRENLLIHLATAKEYRFGTRFYNELVLKYPEQETLILGILNPVSLDVSVTAQDGEVLWYDNTLVEDNETNLIDGVSNWTRNFMVRWDITGYGITDDLYPASQLAVLYLNLPLVILNLRLANAHTLYAHSYHIREFLASNGKLDVFIDNLTKKQMLWLYRNIRYIHRNSGKTQTFEILIKNILTDRGLPLAKWSMSHNLVNQLEEIYPKVEFIRTPLNFGFNSAGADSRDIPRMLTAEQPIAKGNIIIQDVAEVEIKEKMENSLKNILSTKILESSVLDLNDATPFKLSDALLNHWLFLAHTQRYNTFITVVNPKTGGNLTFSMLEAFIVFLFSFNLARGFRLINIPTLEAINVRRLTMPSKVELRGIVNPALVSEELIDISYKGINPVSTYISTLAFHEAVVDIHKGQLWHRELYTTREHYVERGLVQQMTSRFYRDFPCDLANNVTFDSWFTSLGLDIASFNSLEADLLANDILAKATGTNLRVSQSLKNLQSAMIRLMTQLSSYSIQYLQSINSSPIEVIEWPMIRAGDSIVNGRSQCKVQAIDYLFQDIRAKGRELLNLDLNNNNMPFVIKDKILSNDKVPLQLDWSTKVFDRLRTRGEISNIRVLSTIEDISILGTDTPNLTTADYQQVAKLTLDNAFLTLDSGRYTLDQTDLDTLSQRWDAFVLTQKDLLTVDILDGINLPEIVLTNTTLDGINLPDIIIPVTVLDGINLPEAVNITTLDGINLFNDDITNTTLDGINLV